MQKNELPDSQHFTLKQLTNGVYACIHKSGGAAYSNAGIVDLGDRTIVVDAFDTQPFLGFCDIDRYRKQMFFFQDSGYDVLVPGHGPVGGWDDIALQIEYMDVMEELVGNVVQRGGSFEEAMQITLPEPFSKWLFGGMGRFEANVRYLFTHFGGDLPRGEQ